MSLVKMFCSFTNEKCIISPKAISYSVFLIMHTRLYIFLVCTLQYFLTLSGSLIFYYWGLEQAGTKYVATTSHNAKYMFKNVPFFVLIP